MRTKLQARQEVIELRRSGATYAKILDRFSITKSTLWRWLKSEGLVTPQSQRTTSLRILARERAAVVIRRRRLERTDAIMLSARQQVGPITQRELLLIGAALYWAEGSKQKPHHVSASVIFSNSDPHAALVVIQWLRCCCGVTDDRMTFELYIHE
jgi:hypothetical protein